MLTVGGSLRPEAKRWTDWRTRITMITATTARTAAVGVVTGGAKGRRVVGVGEGRDILEEGGCWGRIDAR